MKLSASCSEQLQINVTEMHGGHCLFHYTLSFNCIKRWRKKFIHSNKNYILYDISEGNENITTYWLVKVKQNCCISLLCLFK